MFLATEFLRTIIHLPVTKQLLNTVTFFSSFLKAVINGIKGQEQ